MNRDLGYPVRLFSPTAAQTYRNDLANPIWQEVAGFLRSSFRPDLCHGMDSKVREAFEAYPDPATFYRETDIYCYHGPAYFLEGIKRPYYAMLLLETANQDCSILDYGCGAGDDGLLFSQLGYNVSMADVESKSLAFALWRAQRRGHWVGMYTLNVNWVIPQHTIVWCMDVLEHLPPEQHLGLLNHLSTLGKRVFINLVSDPHADGRLHYPVDVPTLTDHVRSFPFFHATDFYEGRVRILVYGEKT